MARGKSGIMLQHGHRSRSLCNRIYYGAGTPIPANAQRLLGLASDLDGHMRTSRAQVPVKTAMKKDQMQNPVLRTVHEKKEFLPDPLT